MELIDRVKELLRREYGILTEEDLMRAIERQPQIDIGIFVSGCGRKECRHVKRVG